MNLDICPMIRHMPGVAFNWHGTLYRQGQVMDLGTHYPPSQNYSRDYNGSPLSSFSASSSTFL